LISEGNVGLMQAVKRFGPDKGIPFCDLRHVVDQGCDPRIYPTLVVVGEDWHHRQPQETFFNLRKTKSKISALEEGDLRPDQVKLIARRLGVTEQDVVDMDRRLGGDVSLNALCVPKIRFCNIGDERRRGQAVM
jgi:RNA polymerase sigma-32 factor